MDLYCLCPLVSDPRKGCSVTQYIARRLEGSKEKYLAEFAHLSLQEKVSARSFFAQTPEIVPHPLRHWHPLFIFCLGVLGGHDPTSSTRVTLSRCGIAETVTIATVTSLFALCFHGSPGRVRAIDTLCLAMNLHQEVPVKQHGALNHLQALPQARREDQTQQLRALLQQGQRLHQRLRSQAQQTLLPLLAHQTSRVWLRPPR